MTIKVERGQGINSDRDTELTKHIGSEIKKQIMVSGSIGITSKI